MRRVVKFLADAGGVVVGVAQAMLGAVPAEKLRELQCDLAVETARGQHLRAKAEELRREVDVIQARYEQTRRQSEQDLRRQYDESHQLLEREIADRTRLITELQAELDKMRSDKDMRHKTFMARSAWVTELANAGELLIEAIRYDRPLHEPAAALREKIDRARRS